MLYIFDAFRAVGLFKIELFSAVFIISTCLGVGNSTDGWQGSKTGEFEWYWLQNKVEDSASNFANVNSDGDANSGSAGNSNGVRPVFLLS